MKRQKITPVILSGGAGTRLWPLSRMQSPKQMLRLLGERSMIQATALRTPEGQRFTAPIIVAGAAHRTEIEKQMQAINVSIKPLILEPAGRNTAPAIALAAHAALRTDPDALILVMPSDQVIADISAFLDSIECAASVAGDGWLTTFGIEPTRAETGYGYIEGGDSIESPARAVVRFVEKPDATIARDYVEAGNFFWNAGIFMMRAQTYLDTLSTHAPQIAAAVDEAYKHGKDEDALFIPAADAFETSPSDSIDYAVMEKADKVAVVPVNMGWSDIGAFNALWEQLPRDPDGNAADGNVIALDSTNCLFKSDGPMIAALGVSGLAVIATGDAILVLPQDRAQDVKLIVEELKRIDAPELDRHMRPENK